MLMFGATGSAIVFLNEQDEILNQNLVYLSSPGQNAELTSLQTIMDAARQVRPDLEVGSVVLPETENRSIVVQMRTRGESARGEANAPQILVYVNPYNGIVLGARDRNQSGLRWIRVLHSNLHAGKTGRLIVGIFGLLLALLCATGIIVWASGKRSLKINPRASWKRIVWDLHNAVGVYAIVFIFVIALSGAYFSWSQETTALINWLTGSAPRLEPPQSKKPETDLVNPLSLDEIAAKADEALPTDRTIQIIFPANATGAITVSKQPPAEIGGFVRSRVFLNNLDGSVLRIEDARQASTGAKILSLMTPLHFGTIGGIWTRVLWALSGLALPLLFITGFLMWWNRVVRKRIRT